ncbi:MAG: anti-sigma regulatory factor [Burkholderiaceae bacterium]
MGGLHTAFPMDDMSRVGEARRFAAQLSANEGFGEVDAGRLALVVTELGTNLVKHATGGRLLLSVRRPGAEIEAVSIDAGPGISDIGRCMGDGFSTGGSPGTGLGALRRMADDFDIHSSVPGGTVVVARVRREGVAPVEGSIRFGAIALPAPGETVCGDGWALAEEGGEVAVLMADGLGHGPQAAEASQAAAAVFGKNPFTAPAAVLEEAHGVLRMTRGAAVTVYKAQATDGTLRSAGAGNVVTRVISGVSDKTVLSQHGTIGVQVRRIEEVGAEWPPHAVIVTHSDGIQTRWPGSVAAPLLGRDPTLLAAVLIRDFCRGRDDATVLVLRRN